MKELWKPCATYSDRYEVSNLGRVRSLYMATSQGVKLRDKPKILKQYPHHKNGYMNVILRKDGSKKTRGVHRLVAKAFLPNPENKPQVNHIDSDKTNNDFRNLEWATRSENMSHSYKNGTHTAGEESNLSKLTESKVLSIRKSYKQGVSIKSLADKNNVLPITIMNIVNKKTWKYV